MKKSSPLLIALIALIVGALALGALYVYSFLSLSKMEERQRSFAGEIKNADKIIVRENQNKEKLEQYFVTDGEQAAFVSEIEGLCFRLSLLCDPGSLSEAPETPESVKLFSLGISAQGSFDSVIALADYFESSPYPIILSKSTLTSKGEEGWGGVFQFSVPVLITQ